MTLIHSTALSDFAYHAAPGVTYHRLRDFINEGPLFYKRRYITGEIPSRPATDWGELGKAYHLYALDGPEAFTAKVMQTPATYPATPKKKDDPVEQKPWTMAANFCKDWVEARREQGTIVLSADEYAAAEAIGRNCRANPHAARLLGCGWAEITVEQTEPRFPVPVKGRIDWLASTSTKAEDAWAIVDVKGTSNFNGFEREALSLDYHRQQAFYRWLVYQEIGKLLPCYLVAVDKSGSHRCRPYALEKDLLDIGQEKNERDMDNLAAAYAANEWHIDHDDSMRSIVTPKWMLPNEEAHLEVL